MCRCKKIGNLTKSGIFQNREASSGEIDHFSCGAKKKCLQHPIYCCIKVQMKKKREVDKTGNLAKSGNWQYREFDKIGNFAKSRISHSREAPIRILMGYSTTTVAVLKRVVSNMLYTAV